MTYVNGHLLFIREQAIMAQPFDPDDLAITGDAFPIAEEVDYMVRTSKGLFSASENGIITFQMGAGGEGVRLVWYDRNGKKVGSIPQDVRYYDVRISNDGKRLATTFFDLKSRNIDVWIYEIPRNIWTRFTFDRATERFPRWSPDDRTILFNSNRKGVEDLYQRLSIGAGSEELLFESNLPKSPHDWSRDGKFIAFGANDPKKLSDIWILPLTGERKPFIFVQTEFNETRPAFSPDGRWIAFQSNASGRDEIYIRPFPGPGGQWQVSTNEGTRPRWRRDGKELFFLEADDKFMVADIRLGSKTLEIGQVRQLFQARPFLDSGRDGYDVSGDGQRFLIPEIGGGGTSIPITLVINWPAELRKKQD